MINPIAKSIKYPKNTC